MKKVDIEFHTASGGSVHVKAVAHDAFISEGCLWLDLDEDGTRTKCIPLSRITCIDFDEASDDSELIYD